MRKNAGTIASTGAVLLALTACQKHDTRPNIIFFLVDNFVRMAAEGAVLTNAVMPIVRGTGESVPLPDEL